MTKKQLIRLYADRCDVSYDEAEKYLERLFSIGADPGIFVQCLLKGERVCWPNFGTFSTETIPERIYWNRYTHKHYLAPSRLRVSFTAARALRNALVLEVEPSDSD